MDTNRDEKIGLIRKALLFAFDGVVEHAVSWLVVWLSFFGYLLLGGIVTALVVGAGIKIVDLLMSNEVSILAILLFMVCAIAFMLLAIGYGLGLLLGITRTVIQFYDTHVVQYKPIISVSKIFALLAASFLQSLLIGLGLALFIIPGIMAYLRCMFTLYILVDKNLGPVESIQASWNLTRGRYDIMLGFAIVTMLLYMIPLIGWLMASLMTAYMYRELERTQNLI